MEQKEVYLLIVSASVTSFVFSVSLVYLMVLYQRRRENYQKEIAKIRIEIKEQTLKNISWEIHDNIGQILSTMNLYSYRILEAAPVSLQPNVEEMQELIKVAITEVRSLSKVLNTDYIKNVGLLKSIELELDRMKRLRFFGTQLIVEGTPFPIAENDEEVILLRILQEFLSNTMKHAEATEIKVKFQYDKNTLNISVKDNGKGFEMGEMKGTGLLNMSNRAKLIGADFALESKINQGTQLNLIYKN